MRDFKSLYDFSAHRANVGAPVSLNFRLVAHSAHAETIKGLVHRICNRTSDARFPDARRPDQNQNGAFIVAPEFPHRKIFHDTIFDFLKSVMVAFKRFPRTFHIVKFLHAVKPRKLRYQFKIIARGKILRRIRVGQLEFFKFAVNRFFDFPFKMKTFDFCLKLLVVGRVAFRIRSQFLLNGAHFFTQKIFTLIFFDFFIQFILNLLLNA